MSSKISRRHTRGQKKMRGSGWFFSDPPPRVVNYETGAFQFYDPMTRSSKVYDPTLCGVRNFNPMTDNLNLPVNPQIPAPRLLNNTTGVIEFVDPMTRNTRRFDPKNGITMELGSNSFGNKFGYQPICGPRMQGGKLTKHIMKRSKTRKTHRNKKINNFQMK
jgi:hypothetical protein